MTETIEDQIKIKGTPFEKKVTINAVARRNICRIVVNDMEEYDMIISGFYEDEDGVNWVQGVNISDLIDGAEVADLSNIVVRTNDISVIEYSDLSVYDVKMTDKQASSIMHRTDRIVKEAKNIVFNKD